MVSIKDVAKYCGTSISTVSNVINGTKIVSDELEKRIRDGIAELGYEVNPVARSLKSKKSGTVGVIITSVDRIFFTRVLKGIQDVMATAGYRLTFCSSNDSLEQERSFFNMLCNNWVDGIIIDSVAGPGQYYDMAAAGSGRKKIPVVGLECNMIALGTDSVGIDNRKAACDATRFLMGKGCAHIAHIAGVRGSPVSQARQQGFMEAVSGFSFDVEYGDFSPNSGYEAISKLLARNVRLDGVFAANDQMAVGAMYALAAVGVRIPGDIKVMGFDNTFVASLTKPSLSTIHVPKYRMGLQAAEQLLLRMNGEDAQARHIELPYELLDRQSTGNETNYEWDMEKW